MRHHSEQPTKNIEEVTMYILNNQNLNDNSNTAIEWENNLKKIVEQFDQISSRFTDTARKSGWVKNYKVTEIAHFFMLNVAKDIQSEFPNQSEFQFIRNYFTNKRSKLENMILYKIPSINKDIFFSFDAKSEIAKIEKKMPDSAYELGLLDEIIACLDIAANRMTIITILPKAA